jgi:hypothetical protein
MQEENPQMLAEKMHYAEETTPWANQNIIL